MYYFRGIMMYSTMYCDVLTDVLRCTTSQYRCIEMDYFDSCDSLALFAIKQESHHAIFQLLQTLSLQISCEPQDCLTEKENRTELVQGKETISSFPPKFWKNLFFDRQSSLTWCELKGCNGEICGRMRRRFYMNCFTSSPKKVILQ